MDPAHLLRGRAPRRFEKPEVADLHRAIGQSSVLWPVVWVRVTGPCPLDPPVMPKHVEGTRANLKRLVRIELVAETEPGLFAQPRPMAGLRTWPCWSRTGRCGMKV